MVAGHVLDILLVILSNFCEPELIIISVRRNFQPYPHAKEISLSVGPPFRFTSTLLSFITQTIDSSKAVQINMNLSVLEEWVGQMGLPRGVQSHLTPVRDLLSWLQVFTSLDNVFSSVN